MVAAIARLQKQPDLPCKGCLLDHLPARQRSVFCSGLLRHSYERERPIYYEGTPPLAVFNILQGGVKLWRMGHAGDQHVVSVRGPGSLIGCRAVICQRPYTSTAEPLEHTVACTIPRDVFLPLIRENHGLAYRLLEQMAKSSFEIEDNLSARVMDSVTKRTARFLLHLGSDPRVAHEERSALHLPAKREDLAHLVGTAPETLSRTLHSLASRGILDLSGKQIRVLDMEALRRLAG